MPLVGSGSSASYRVSPVARWSALEGSCAAWRRLAADGLGTHLHVAPPEDPPLLSLRRRLVGRQSRADARRAARRCRSGARATHPPSTWAPAPAERTWPFRTAQAAASARPTPCRSADVAHSQGWASHGWAQVSSIPGSGEQRYAIADVIAGLLASAAARR